MLKTGLGSFTHRGVQLFQESSQRRHQFRPNSDKSSATGVYKSKQLTKTRVWTGEPNPSAHICTKVTVQVTNWGCQVLTSKPVEKTCQSRSEHLFMKSSKTKPSKRFTQISLSNCYLCNKVSVKKPIRVFLKTAQKPGANSVSRHLTSWKGGSNSFNCNKVTKIHFKTRQI